MRWLVKEAGAVVESKDKERKTPLSWAAENGRLEAVKFLAKGAGADVESRDDLGGTPLSHAAMNGHLDVVTFLAKEAGGDVESKDYWGKTALDLARREGAQGSWRSERCRAVAAWLEAFMETKGGKEAGD